MNIFPSLASKIKSHKLISLALLIAILGFGAYKYFTSSKTTSPTYQTALVERGMLISSISASGTITSSDTTYITTGATGTITKVYIKNGDKVTKDQKIAEIQLDDDGQLNQTTAWNNYQVALVSSKTAITSKQTLEIVMLQKKQAVVDAENAQRDSISGGWNPTTKQPYTQNDLDIVAMKYSQAKQDYDAAVKGYQIADSNISLTNAKAFAAYRNYQKVSSSIYAPATGIVNNLVLAPGVVFSNSNNSSITVSTGTDSAANSSSVSSKNIGAIKNPDGKYQATVSLSEVDVTKVQSGQKVSLTMDAFTDATLTGTVLAINTSGNVSSGVTSYSTTILLNPTTLNIYTNMAISAKIITNTKDNVLMVPQSAVQTLSGAKSIRILTSGKLTSVPVEVGIQGDTQTEIISGVNEGDSVVTSVINPTKTSTTTTASPFGVMGGSSGGVRYSVGAAGGR